MLPLRGRRLRGLQEHSAMKLFTGSLAAGLVLLAAGAQAQAPYVKPASPYTAASDFDAPYAAAPRGPEPNRPGPRYGYGPSLLPSTEVYAVLRDNGFSPLGIPQAPRLRLHDRGDRSRRRGRPAGHRRAQRPDHPLPAGLPDGRQLQRGVQSALDGPSGRLPPPPAHAPDQVQAAPRRHGRPHVASRTVPMPKANPLAAKPAAAEPVKQAAAPAPKPAEVQAGRRRR